MWLRCALVSRTLATAVALPLLSSGDDEQPATSSSSASAAAIAAFASRLSRIGGAR